jgi:hypothetical protein
LALLLPKPLSCIQGDSLSSLAFLYVIFWAFLERKVGHPFLEGKGGQPVQNLLQVTP